MLVNSKKVLEDAKAGKYAVLAPDFVDLDSARVYARTAQEKNIPVILSYAQVFDKLGFLTLEEAAAVGKVVAESVHVPVVLHLDHGEDIEYVKRGVDLGFTSVMLDASMKSFEENVKMTKEIVDYAHAKGVTVEAEIGHVGQGENYSDYSNTDSVYTTVEEAVAFVEQTNVDSLAVSIGTAHGVYKSLENPVLNFERLKELKDAVSVPLVLHGSSGSGDENIRRCAKEGITKFNLYTDFLLGAMDNINKEEPKDYMSVKKAADQGMKDVIEHYLSLINE